MTISTSHDTAGLADKVQALVDAANQPKQTINTLTAYDATTKTAQALTGDFAARPAVEHVWQPHSKMPSAGPGSSAPSLVGVWPTGPGIFKFDRSKFLAVYNADPTWYRQDVHAGRFVGQPRRHVHLRFGLHARRFATTSPSPTSQRKHLDRGSTAPGRPASPRPSP